MSINVGGGGSFAEKILNTLKDLQGDAKGIADKAGEKGNSSGGMSFADHLKQGINEVNDKNKVADKMGVELATGKTGNIHETMLAATQAELSFNLMVQLRNKALEAYSEIIRMPV